MNILRCHLRAFGKLCDLRLIFGEGLNLIFAANEGGKSTLQRFLIGLLYGQLRADLRTQKRLDAWADQYKPWHGSDYGGTIWCDLASGREIEIRRTFGKEQDRVEVRTGAGEDITSQYQELRNGDLLFAQHHLKLPKELFESAAVIRENKAGELEGRETLRDRIANLAQSGDERVSVRRCLSRLEEALESIGSERAPTRPLKQTLEQLKSLQGEREALLSRRTEFQKWILGRSRLADEVKRRERDLVRAGWVVRAARFKEAQLKVRSLEEIDAEIRALRQEMAAVGGDPQFPVQYLDELNQLEWAQEELQKRSGETRPGKQQASMRLQALAAERQKLEPYSGLVAMAEADKVTEWFVRYLSLSRQRDDAQQASDTLQQEMESLAEALSGCGPLVVSSEVDWQQVSLEASERERIASQQVMALADRISAEKTALAAQKGRRVRWMVFGGAAAAIALAFGLWIGGLLGPAQPVGRAHLAFMAFSVVAAVLLFGAGSLTHRRVRQVEATLRSLEAEQTQLRSTPNEPYSKLSQAAAESGFAAVEEFLSATLQASQIRQRMDDLALRLRQSEQERQKTHADADQVYLMLKETLGKVGLSCAPANLTEQIDVLRANLRRYRELDADYRESARRVESLEKEDAQLSGEIEAKSGRVHAILAETGLSSTGQFREECGKCKRLLELRDKESARTREFLRLSRDLTLEQWRQSLKDLGEKVGDDFRVSDAVAAPMISDGHFPLLPYLPSLSDAEQEEKRIADSVASLREEHARVSERVSQAFRNYRTPAEVEEDLRLAERTTQGLARNRKALIIALTAIRELSRRQQEASAPRLNRAVESRFQQICQGRYKEVKIDPDFQIWLREASTDELRNVESLSRGTQDQLYFALRFGILEMLASPEEPCPCFLDEPFAAYDQTRIAGAFQVLEEEAGRRQIFLFTCREDIRDLARSHHAHIVEIGI